MSETKILLTIKLQQQLFVDPKRITLLKEIQACGSINQAAKNANVSYKSAWDHLAAMNTISPKPLLERNVGGKNGGGTALTAYALRLLQLYDLLAQTQEKAFHILQDDTIPLDSLLSATARFSLQSSARNQFFGNIVKLTEADVHCDVDIAISGLGQPLTAQITRQSAQRLKLALGKEVMLMIKAPWLQISQLPLHGTNCFAATISDVQHNGDEQEVRLQVGDVVCYATAPRSNPLTTGQAVWLTIEPEQIVLLSLW